MNVTNNCIIHNRFDINVIDAKSGEIIQKGKAENIVLDRMFTRLCNFDTYFTNIVFGKGTGTTTPDRTILFNRLGYKAAQDEEIIRAYPISKWTRKIRLDTLEYNGETITEVGISDTTTNINTHALITDAEGNPLSIDKTDLIIVDIYASVYIEIPNIDSGLFFVGNGWRNYLTGAAAPNNNLIICGNTSTDTSNGAIKAGTRVVDIPNKRVKISTRFGVEDYNKDVAYVGWLGGGLYCKLPRLGIWEGKQRNDVELGVGDGIKTHFKIPNVLIENLQVFVEGVINADWQLERTGGITFDTPVADGEIVTANYKSLLIPKDNDHVLDTEFVLQYDNLGDLINPIEPTPIPDFSNVPGEKEVIAGTEDYGFFGEVDIEEFIDAEDICDYLGLTAGVPQYSDSPWLKVIDGEKMLLISKKTIRHSISWDDINAVGAVFGTPIVIDGQKYLVRLLSTEEWDRFIYPLQVEHYDGADEWANYTNADLIIASGNGRSTWTSTPSGSNRIYRGSLGVSISNNFAPSNSDSNYGFRPVLEVLL